MKSVQFFVNITLLVVGLTTYCSCVEDVVQQQGTVLELKCKSANVAIKWTKVDGTVDNSWVTSQGGNNELESKLRLENLQPEHAGHYKCATTNGTIQEFDVTVISFFGKNESLVKDVKVNQTELVCSVNNFGLVITQLMWKRAGEMINNTDKYSVETNGSSSSLFIHSPTEQDAGAYKCVVAIEDVSSKFEEIFSLNTAPTVQPIGKLRSKVEGEKVKIVCNVTGYPVPKITWYKQLEDETELKEVKYDARVNASEQDGVPDAILVITDLKIETDRGDYICVASNDLGSVNATIPLKVKDKLAAVWPFLGICAEVLIFCTIIFIFEKRRNKRMEEEEEVDAVKQDLMNKSNGAVEDREVRQRTSATKA